MHSLRMYFKHKFFIEQRPIQGSVLKMYFQKMMQKSRMSFVGGMVGLTYEMLFSEQWKKHLLQTFGTHPNILNQKL